MEEWKVLPLVSGIPTEYASFSHATSSFDARNMEKSIKSARRMTTKNVILIPLPY